MLDAEALVHLDMIRAAVFRFVRLAPRELVALLRRRLALGRFECVRVDDNCWVDMLVMDVFASSLTLLGDLIEREEWDHVPMAYARVLEVPRAADMQDRLLDSHTRVLVDVAVSIEQKLPQAIVEEPDQGRLGKRTRSLEENYLKEDAYILEVVAAVLRSLCNSRAYEGVAAEVLLHALSNLEWPTVRHMKWFTYAPTPRSYDPRWLKVLTRRVVRTFTVRY